MPWSSPICAHSAPTKPTSSARVDGHRHRLRRVAPELAGDGDPPSSALIAGDGEPPALPRHSRLADDGGEARRAQADVARAGRDQELGRTPGAAHRGAAGQLTVDGVQPRLQVAQPRQREGRQLDVDVEAAVAPPVAVEQLAPVEPRHAAEAEEARAAQRRGAAQLQTAVLPRERALDVEMVDDAGLAEVARADFGVQRRLVQRALQARGGIDVSRFDGRLEAEQLQRHLSQIDVAHLERGHQRRVVHQRVHRLARRRQKAHQIDRRAQLHGNGARVARRMQTQQAAEQSLRREAGDAVDGDQPPVVGEVDDGVVVAQIVEPPTTARAARRGCAGCASSRWR